MVRRMSKDFEEPAPGGTEYETKASRQTVYKVTLKVTQRQADILLTYILTALAERGPLMDPDVREHHKDLRDTLAKVIGKLAKTLGK
jgi:hypothetical protein